MTKTQFHQTRLWKFPHFLLYLLFFYMSFFSFFSFYFFSFSPIFFDLFILFLPFFIVSFFTCNFFTLAFNFPLYSPFFSILFTCLNFLLSPPPPSGLYNESMYWRMSSEYENVRSTCLETGELWTDPDFPANNSSLFRQQNHAQSSIFNFHFFLSFMQPNQQNF